MDSLIHPLLDHLVSLKGLDRVGEFAVTHGFVQGYKKHLIVQLEQCMGMLWAKLHISNNIPSYN